MPAHRARIVTDFKNEMGISFLNIIGDNDWPSCSPDLNPIEGVWNRMKCEIRSRPACNNLRELENLLVQVWNGIPQRDIDRLIASMTSRVRHIILANGSHIRY